MRAIHQRDLEIPIKPIGLVNLSCAELARTIPPSDDWRSTPPDVSEAQLDFGSAQACRLDLALTATGNWDLIQVFDEVLLSVTDAQFTESPDIVVQGEDRLKLRIISSGSLIWRDCAVRPSPATLSHEGPCTVLSWHPRGVDLCYYPGTRERLVMLTVHCSMSFAGRFFKQNVLRDILGDVRKTKKFGNFLPVLPVTPRARLVVNEVLWSPYVGKRRFSFLQAKCIELMCLVSREMEEQSRYSIDTGNPIRLTRRDLDCLNEVRRRIETDLAGQHVLSMLARECGMNVRKLSQGFRKLIGRTPHQYLLDCRMQEACRLLKEHNLSVAEVAYKVGYQHAANFSTAFRRYFGFSPHCLSGQMYPSLSEAKDARRIYFNPVVSCKALDR